MWRVCVEQVTLLRAGRGEEVIGETRGWDEASGATRSQRAKEGVADYRFFPEPDLPQLSITDDYVRGVRVRIISPMSAHL